LIDSEFNRINWGATEHKDIISENTGPGCSREFKCTIKNGENQNLFYNSVNAADSAGCINEVENCTGWESCLLQLDAEGNLTSVRSVADYSDKFESALEHLNAGPGIPEEERTPPRRRGAPRRRSRRSRRSRRNVAPSPPPGQCDCHVPAGWYGDTRCQPSHESMIRSQIQGQFNEFKQMFQDQIVPAKAMAVRDDGWDWTGVDRNEKDGKVFLVGRWPVEWAEKTFHLESGLPYLMHVRLDSWASVDGETCTFKLLRDDNGNELMSQTQRLRLGSCDGGSYSHGYARDFGVSGSGGHANWNDCWKDLSWPFVAPTDTGLKVRIHCNLNSALNDEGWGFNSLFFTLE